ncbi:MAG: hypothetical protein QNJ15_03610 [Erythrobacter sp.]|nr:hypothetical protein [Erythrobacter sp.]
MTELLPVRVEEDFDLPGVSPEEILKFLLEKIKDEAMGWAGTQVFDLIFDHESELEEVKRMLAEILANQELIIQELRNIMREIEWQHLVTRAWEAEKFIESTFEQLQLTLRIKDPEQRERNAREIREAILDQANGILIRLFEINDALMGGSTVDPQEKGLLQVWVEKLNARMEQHPRKLYLHKYYQLCQAYLGGVMHLQFIGLTLYVGAAEGDELILEEVKNTFEKLQNQNKRMQKVIPASAHHIIKNPGHYYVLFAANRETKDIVYGSPYGSSAPLDCLVYLRERHKHNADEEWQFLPEPKGDPATSFVIGERSRDLPRHGGGFMKKGTGGNKDSVYCHSKRADGEKFEILPRYLKDKKKLGVVLRCKKKYYLGLEKDFRGLYNVRYVSKPYVWEIVPVS